MIRAVLAITLFALACVFTFAYFEMYFKWRDCFNELGRCFDPNSGVVYLEQSGIVWSLFAVIAFVAALYQTWQFKKRRRVR